MGYLAALGGLLGAGGSVAGGLLGNKKSKSSTSYAVPRDPFADPVTAGSAFDVLLNLGIADPTILNAASPLTRAMQGVSRAEPKAKKNRFMAETLPLIFDAISATGSTDPSAISNHIRSQFGIQNPTKTFFYNQFGVSDVKNNLFGSKFTSGKLNQRILEVLGKLESASGLSIADLFAQEKQYRDTVSGQFAQLQNVANQNLQGRVAASTLRSNMLQGLGDNVGSIRGQELTRLNQQYDTARDSLLRAANAGGFNPGRALGELERSRTVDADLEAMNRAIALITGQTNALNVLSGQPIEQSAQLGGVRASGTAAPGSTQISPSNNLGAGIAQAVPAGLLSYNIASQMRGPATSYRPTGLGDFNAGNAGLYA